MTMTLPQADTNDASLVFCGITPQPPLERARAVIVPVPYEATTSYLTGTRLGPSAILAASGQVELWDDETGTEPWDAGLHTLAEVALPEGDSAGALARIREVAATLGASGAFPVFLGGEHSITPAIVEALAPQVPGLSVLQIDAHADLREEYQGSPYSHACAMRRVLDVAPCTQVAIRSLSREEAEALPHLDTRIFYDRDMRRDPGWMDRVIGRLSDRVYLTIDCDGLDPAIMPAVGTPEPGGLGWYETLALMKKLFAAREVVACDVVELCPQPGMIGSSFLCAKLVYKLLAYRFAAGH